MNSKSFRVTAQQPPYYDARNAPALLELCWPGSHTPGQLIMRHGIPPSRSLRCADRVRIVAHSSMGPEDEDPEAATGRSSR